MSHSQFINQLKSKLSFPTLHKGIQPQWRKINHNISSTGDTNTSNYKPAAVLILLFPKNNSIHFCLTKRTNTVEHHKGQISFPGGSKEAGETIRETALRETHEELGVKLSSDSIIGSLTPFNIPVSKFQIYPFIAWSDSLPKISPDPQEVEQVFFPNLSSLSDDSICFTEARQYNGTTYKSPYYTYQEGKVWGATALILTELKYTIEEFK